MEGFQTALLGSIPACAGEAVVAFLVFAVAGVYPRVCGGSPDLLRLDVMEGGLSPRVRGKPQLPS